MFLIPYAVVPYIFAYANFPIYVALLAQLTIISIVTFVIVLNIPFGYNIKSTKLTLDFDTSIYVLYGIFLLLIFVVIATAPRIPIIESLRGASQEELSQYREDFLKTRQGWGASLGYLVGTINGAVLPYLIAISFLKKHKYRFLFAFIFLLYCICFLEKAYFLKIAIPIFFIYLHLSKNKALFVIKGTVVILALILLMYFISGSTGFDVGNDESFFSILYLPSGTWETLVWRVTVVPIITALDAIRVFISEFHGEFFYGNTSSFFAFLTGSERINFERYLYQTQFGGSETGNANSYFVIEAYINFGITGVIIITAMIAKLIKGVIKMNDIALLSVIPLFLLNLFSAGFIGTMLSGGYLLLFIISGTVVFKHKN
jgi:oligosaccharide repeat unit polymerase